MTFSGRQGKAAKPIPGVARGGDQENPTRAADSFDALFQLHWEQVCAVLYRLVGDWDEAQELALEVFWRLYRQPPAKEGSLSGWLYRVATNMGYNALRARLRRKRYEEQAGSLADELARPPDPAQEVEQAEERQRVRQALAQMKPRSAQLLILRHSGHSYQEISQALAIAPASVGSLLSRAEREFEQKYRQTRFKSK